jgi:hypothetical protein
MPLPASLVLFLAAVLLLTSCSNFQPSSRDIVRAGFTELRATAVAVIADASRRDLYLEHSRQLESELLAFETYAAGFIEDYRRAFTDYATDATELEQISAAFRQRQRATQDRFVELHLAMADTLIETEWPPLSRQEVQIIQSLLRATPGTKS